MLQALQLAGAITILIPFVAVQLGRLEAKSSAYLALNFAGSLLLVGVAIPGRNWGFILLEGVWSLTSAWGLAKLRSRPARTRRDA